jgi:hypothetical protein
MQLSFIELGIWLALPLTGYLLLRLISPNVLSSLAKIPLFPRFALYFSAGMAIWSIPLLGSVIVGVYDSKMFGFIGWLVLIFFTFILIKDFSISSLETIFTSLKRINIYEVVYVFGLLVLAVIYFGYPNESILGGRDMGIYANHGIFIANHGYLNPDYPIPYESSGFYLLGLFATPNSITIQFGHLYPSWLAQAYNTFGIEGLFRMNALLALLSLGLFRGLLNRFVSTPFAVLGVLFLGFNVSQIWLARITLTEIMTQMWIMAAFITADIALQEDQPSLARWSGVFFGFTALCRIDSFLFLPLIIIANSIVRFLGQNDNDNKEIFWKSLYQGAFPVFLLALSYYYFFSRPYFSHVSVQLSMIGGLLGVAIVWCWTSYYVKKLIQKQSIYLIVIFGIVATTLISVFLYGHIIRPYLEPFSTFNLPGHALNGTRSFRENSIVNLGLYLSVPVLYLALGGWLVSFWHTWFLRKWEWLLPMITISGFATLYLYDPSITPDHYWAIRRFVPIVIPGFILFCMFGLDNISNYIKNRIWQNVLIAVISMSLLVFTYYIDKPIAAHAENDGYWQQLSVLAKTIPDDGIILAEKNDTSEIYNTPLFMSFNKKIVPLNIYKDDKEILNLIDGQLIKGEKVYFLGSNLEPAFVGYDVIKIGETTLKRNFMESKTRSLPNKVLHYEKIISIYNLQKSDHIKLITYGAQRVFGVPEKGFYDTEVDPQGNIFRWTNGQAELTIPWFWVNPPKSLQVVILSNSYVSDISVKINNIKLIDEKLKPGSWEKVFSLDSYNLKSPIKVEIDSNSWKPSDFISGSNDQRQLGVAVSSIKFLNETSETSAITSSSKETASSDLELIGDSEITISGNDTVYASVKVANNSNISWSYQAEGSSSYGEIRLGILWFSKQENGKKVGEDRVDLPYNMNPGDETIIETPLRPIGKSGSTLSPGDYEVWIGPLQEGVAWFYTFGDEVIKLDVKVQ